jgi:surface antigen
MTTRRHHLGILLALTLAGCGASANQRETGALMSFQAGDGARQVAVLPSNSDLAKALDDRDRLLAGAAQFDALENGSAGAARDWTNPVTGNGGVVTPGPIYSVNQYSCRDFTQRIVAGSRSETMRITACKQPDGTWRPIS